MIAVRRYTPTARRVLRFDAPRDEWLRVRRNGIGSSDVAAILGVSPYTTPRHVYFDKLGELPEQDAGEAALWGNILEDAVSREWARRNKTVVNRVGLVANVDTDWAMCTLDRQVSACPIIPPGQLVRQSGVCALEVKTRSAWVAGRWRGGIPDDVHAQVAWQMFVTGYDHLHVAALIGGQDFRQYTVTRDSELETNIRAIVGPFWERSVGNRVPPPVTDPADLDVEVARFGEFDGSVEVNEPLAFNAFMQYQDASKDESTARGAKALAKAKLVELLGGHAIGTIAGEQMYSYLPSNRAPRVDLETLEAKHPAAFAECVTRSESPTLRINSKFKIEEHR